MFLTRSLSWNDCFEYFSFSSAIRCFLLRYHSFCFVWFHLPLFLTSSLPLLYVISRRCYMSRNEIDFDRALVYEQEKTNNLFVCSTSNKTSNNKYCQFLKEFMSNRKNIIIDTYKQWMWKDIRKANCRVFIIATATTCWCVRVLCMAYH